MLKALKGNPQELQQTLALFNQLQQQAKKQTEQREIPAPKKPRKPRSRSGPTEQLALPIDEQLLELDEPDRTCPACGDRLEPMAGQFESSDMVDFVEISYRLVRAKQQKYVCRCGGCVETAPGPERAIQRRALLPRIRDQSGTRQVPGPYPARAAAADPRAPRCGRHAANPVGSGLRARQASDAHG